VFLLRSLLLKLQAIVFKAFYFFGTVLDIAIVAEHKIKKFTLLS
jgi:hypothetical protein